MGPTLLTMLEMVLEEAARDNGHVFLTRAELHARMATLVDIAIRVGAHNERLVLRGGCVGDALDQRIYLPHLDAAERQCAENVKRMLVRS